MTQCNRVSLLYTYRKCIDRLTVYSIGIGREKKTPMKKFTFIQSFHEMQNLYLD